MATEAGTENTRTGTRKQLEWRSRNGGNGRGELTTRREEGLSGGRSGRRAERYAARSLGWFSIGLGAAQLIAPRRMARVIGVSDSESTDLILRAIGTRELLSGIGILRGRRARRWLWSRVAGDAIDLALLGAAMGSRRADQSRIVATGAAVAGITILDVLAASRLGSGETSLARGLQLSRSVTINKTPDEIYRFWRRLDSLPQFLSHLESVETIDDRRSRWRARGPIGIKLEWEAEIVEDRPGSLIAWRSLEASILRHSGEVRFVPAPGERGTEVHVSLHIAAPAGRIGRTVAKLFGADPLQEIASDLRRLKQVLETGEVVHSEASIHRKPQPSRPPSSTPELPRRKGGV